MRQDKVQKIKNLKQQIAAVHSETGKLKEVPPIWCWGYDQASEVSEVSEVSLNQVSDACSVAGRGCFRGFCCRS